MGFGVSGSRTNTMGPAQALRVLGALLLVVACGGDAEVTPPESDPTVNGDWSGSFGPITVRYSLSEADGTIAGNLEFVAANLVEGSGSVQGSRTGQRIELRADSADFVEIALGAPMTGSASFGGTQSGDQIAGEFDFQATGTHPESGQPFAVRLQPGPAPLTLVRVRR